VETNGVLLRLPREPYHSKPQPESILNHQKESPRDRGSRKQGRADPTTVERKGWKRIGGAKASYPKKEQTRTPDTITHTKPKEGKNVTTTDRFWSVGFQQKEILTKNGGGKKKKQGGGKKLCKSSPGKPGVGHREGSVRFDKTYKAAAIQKKGNGREREGLFGAGDAEAGQKGRYLMVGEPNERRD